MDRGTHAALYRTNVPEADCMRTDDRIEDLVRAFKVLPKATQREYSLTVGEVKYGLDQINNFARDTARERQGRAARDSRRDALRFGGTGTATKKE
jgi:hypothetical protein